MRAVFIRRGQPVFRKKLLQAHGGRCPVTGCGVEDVLEAAHISPYFGPLSNEVSNGLLLRADIHTLFDCSLQAFDPGTRRVVIVDSLQTSEYGPLADQILTEPENLADRASSLSLAPSFGAFRFLRETRAALSGHSPASTAEYLPYAR